MRPGVEAAIAFQYVAADVAADLSAYRTDSYLTRELSRKQTDRDVLRLWSYVDVGQDEVHALRTYAAGLDEPKRTEVLGFVNALDGARGRQVDLAKKSLRGSMFSAQNPVATGWERSDAGDSFRGTSRSSVQRAPVLTNPLNGAHPGPTADPDVTAALPMTETDRDALREHERTTHLFDGFAQGPFIRSDLADAARHAVAAIKLGGCDGP